MTAAERELSCTLWRLWETEKLRYEATGRKTWRSKKKAWERYIGHRVGCLVRDCAARDRALAEIEREQKEAME